MDNGATPPEPAVPEPGEPSDRQAQPVDAEQPPRLPFPVVGIGASAGGLEAVSEFLAAMPAEGGMAFVLVQHLSPDRQSMMAEILSKKTEMPVSEVRDGVAVEVNHVYVIRPGHVLTIRDGHLHLGPELGGPRAANRPVDDFFKSLAEEQRERAIAVIMSGMGSNGTAGAQAVKAVGGLCVAQEPESAQFPSMPRHMIDAGVADYILKPVEMPDVLIAYADHPYARGGRELSAAAVLRHNNAQLREVLTVLRTRTRQEFGGYKKPTILRRVQRRMGLTRITVMDEYVKLLRQSPAEVTALADDLLIHVTGFFRDPDAWEVLRERVIVPLIAAREPEGQVRCWVTACSTGDEAYTLAILLSEEAERANKRLDIKVFATDMADRTLTQARAGVYPGGIEAEVTPERLARFFTKEDAVYRVRPDLRERVVFAPQNVLQDPPFSRLDIASCRNLLIYLEPDVQQRVLGLLHFGLREGGALFLGTSETVSSAEGMFEPIDKKAKIFRRIGPTRHGSVEFPTPKALRPTLAGGMAVPALARPPAVRATFAQVTQRALLEHHLPAAVLVDRDYRIQYYQGDTRPFLGPPRGEPTRDLMELVLEGLRGAVRVALRRAATENGPATVRDGWVTTADGRKGRVAITASPAADAGAPDHFVVSFDLQQDAHSAGNGNGNGDGGGGNGDGGGNGNGGGDAAGRVAVDDELRRVRDELQSTIEELQTANEEMKAAAEEASSINEELQSANEELETSKEEMQSLNEELNTVNAQLQARMAEHQTTANDLASLLSSTDIPVLFLDPALRIRRVTPPVRAVIDLLASDVGRPLSDFARKFTDPDLTADAQAVLERLVPVEREVAAHDGRWFLRRVTPYRTTDNRIDGVVIAFVDITPRRRAEEALRASEEQFRRAIEDAPIPVIMQAEDGQVLQVSRAWTELTGYALSDVPTADAWLTRAFGPGADEVRGHMRELFSGHRRSLDVEFAIRTRSGAERHWSFSASAPGAMRDGRRYMVGMAVDVTDRRHAAEALRASEEQFRLLVDGTGDFAIFMLDPAGVITTWNPAAEQILGWGAAEAVGQPSEMTFTPEDRAAGQPELERVEATRTGRAADVRWHVRKDGERFWANGVLTALRDATGGLRGFVKFMRDETDRKHDEEALHASTEAAEQANRTKDEFLATISHELRTPLSAVLLWTKLLRGGKVAPAQASEALAAIETAAEAQRQLIDDLLDSARITSGKLRLELRDVDLPALVRSAVEAIAPTADVKHVALAADLADDVGVVRADPERLRQVLWNLLTNAVKFTPAGGRVEVGLWRRGGKVEVRVADTGQGIPPEFLPHVFEPFRQAEGSTTRTHGGLGLGLSIVRRLVELHGGTVAVASGGVDRGTTFTVRLPLPPVRRANDRRGSAAGAATAPASLDGVRVLLVEDEPNTRAALRAVLAGEKCVVADVGTAAAALAAIAAGRPDVLVCNIGLPGEDGYALVGQIRAADKSGDARPLPAVAVTAFVRAEDRQRALEAGFQDVVAKPVDPEALFAALRKVLPRG